MPLINPYDDRNDSSVGELKKPQNSSASNSGDDKLHGSPFLNPFNDNNNISINPEQVSPYPPESGTPVLDRFWTSGIRDHGPSMIATLEGKPYVQNGSVRKLGENYIYRDSRDGRVKYFDLPGMKGDFLGDTADFGRDIVRGVGAGGGYVAGGGQVTGAATAMLGGQAAATAFDQGAKIAGIKDLRGGGEYLVDQTIESALDGVSELAMLGVSKTAIPYIKNNVKLLWQKSPQMAQRYLSQIKSAATKFSRLNTIGDIPDPIEREKMRRMQALFQGEGMDYSHSMLTGSVADMTNERQMLKADGSSKTFQALGDAINEQAGNRIDKIRGHYNLHKTNPTEAGAALRGEIFEDMAEGGGIAGGRLRVYTQKMNKLKSSWQDKIPEGYHVSTDGLQDYLVKQIQKYNPPLENGAMVIPNGGEGEFADFVFKELQNLKKYAPNSRIDFNRLEMMKKRVGKAFNQGYDLSTSQKEGFYHAIRQTMKDGLDTLDPSGQLSKNFEKYNKFVSDFKNTKGIATEKILNSIEGKQTNEQAVQYVLGGLENNMAASRIAEVRKYLTPHEFDYLSGLALERIATGRNGQFSFGVFAKNWNKLEEPTKKAVFGGEQYPGLMKHLDDFAEVSKRVDMWIQQTNWSNTASHMNMNRTPVTLDPTSWVKAIGEFSARMGRKSQANLLTNKEFLSTLTQYGKLIDDTFILSETGISRVVPPATQKKAKELMARIGVMSFNDKAVEEWFNDAFPEQAQAFKNMVKTNSRQLTGY